MGSVEARHDPLVRGCLLFIVLAIPAIALDFFNQGVEIIAIQQAAASDNGVAGIPKEGQPDRSKASGEAHHGIKVSVTVKYALHGAELFVLLCDVVIFVVVLANGAWIFLRSLKWK